MGLRDRCRGENHTRTSGKGIGRRREGTQHVDDDNGASERWAGVKEGALDIHVCDEWRRSASTPLPDPDRPTIPPPLTACAAPENRRFPAASRCLAKHIAGADRKARPGG